jgi:hypothetical protein
LPDCDIQRCSITGAQYLMCPCVEHNPEKTKWTGQWPGTLECKEYGFWAKMVKGKGWVPCEAHDPEAQPDINRLVVECAWNPEQGRWRRPQEPT